MAGMTDARVDELNEELTRLIPRMREHLTRLEKATDLAEGHAAAALLAVETARVTFLFTQARMPAFGRIQG